MKIYLLFDYKFSKMASLVHSLDRFDLSQNGIVHKYLPEACIIPQIPAYERAHAHNTTPLSHDYRTIDFGLAKRGGICYNTLKRYTGGIQ